MPTTFANTIDGNEILAKRSQCDYAGNDIQTTYATKSELPTATSDLTNDSGFITDADVPVKDVEVDGASVVNAQGVAEITMPDLTCYATTQDLTTGLAGKQDTISDLATIRSGAQLGSTAVQPADMTAALAYKENSANKSQTLDPTSTTEFPSSAATANYVNSSVATSTANFLGNFTLADLGLTYPATDAQIGAALDSHTWPAGVTPTNNDYTYIEIENPQTTGIDDSVERFKFNGTNWVYEYTLNNSSFTAAEKAAIDSGIDSSKVAVYDAHVANSDIHVTLSDKSTWNAKQDAISDLSTIRSGAQAGSSAVQPGDLATVATTGSYDDLSDKPTIPAAQVNSDWNSNSGVSQILNKPQLSTVATTGDYNDLTNKPSIPAAQVNSDWNAASGVAEILNKPVLATVATTGSYNDLSNKPSIPTATSDLTNDSGFITLSDVPAQAQADWTESDTSDPSYIQNKPTLATVATTGDYTDLTNKPSIPAAQVNADWNSSSGVSKILNKPTLATVATSGSYNDLNNKPTIPTATSDLTNDSGFITLNDVPAQVNADWNSSSGASEILNKPTIPSGTQLVPAATSADADKVLTVDAQGVPGWATGGGTQVQSDWAESDSSDPSYIENKPVPKTLTAGTGISITENQSTITIASSVTVPVQDVTVDGSSVVSNGVAAITSPTVDQIYDASSTNAQSGVAVAEGISDAIGDLPTNLSSAQIQALKEALGVDETVLWEGSTTAPTGDNKLSLSITFPETVANFEYLKIFYWYRTTTNAAWKVDMCYVNGGEFHFTCQWPESATGNWFMYRLYGSGTSASGDGGYKAAGSVNTFGSYGGGMWGNGTIWKVVGCHRIASN